MDPDLFGNDQLQALLRRGRSIARLLCSDPRYTYYGRTVGLASPEDGDHPRLGGQAWWGMLATDPARRGQRLALILGAMVIEKMHDRSGFADFFTGVEPGNTGSEAVCARIRMHRTAFATIGCADPMTLGSKRMTK